MPQRHVITRNRFGTFRTVRRRPTESWGPVRPGVGVVDNPAVAVAVRKKPFLKLAPAQLNLTSHLSVFAGTRFNLPLLEVGKVYLSNILTFLFIIGKLKF